MKALTILGGSSGWQSSLLAALSGRHGQQLPLLTVAAMLMTGAALHYGNVLPVLSTLADHSPVGAGTRQAAERILFLLPVTYASWIFGARGGWTALVIASGIMLPCAIDASATTDHALPEMAGVVTVGALLTVAITQQQKEVEAEKKMRDSLQYFVHQTLTAQEDERRRIALELHDETAQALLLICQGLDHLASTDRRRLPAPVIEELEELRTSTVQALADLRVFTQNLRPRVLEDHGLVPALEWLADLLNEQYDVRVTVRADGPLPQQSQEVQLLLFRIIQEALRNVGKHSGASEAVVKFEATERRLRITVSDNGCGFRLSGPLDQLANSGKLGLLGMSERARLAGGTIDIRSTPGLGTSMSVEVPIGDRQPSRESPPARNPRFYGLSRPVRADV